MSSRLLRRRSATAAWIYAAVACGFAGTVVAARVLGLAEFGVFATALVTVGFFQTLLDLTVEESLTKYGFRYVAGRGVGAAPAAVPAGAPAEARGRLRSRRCSSSLSRPSPTSCSTRTASSRRSSRPRSFPSCRRRRTSVRPRFSCTAATTYAASTRPGPRRFGSLAIVIGVHFGVVEALLAIVVAQAISTVVISVIGAVALRRFPTASPQGPRRGRPRDPQFRAPVERRDGRDLAAEARSSRCCSVSCRARSRSASSASRRRRRRAWPRRARPRGSS